MNIEAVRFDGPAIKVALTTPNPANAVVTHLVSDLKLTPLFGMAGVFIKLSLADSSYPTAPSMTDDRDAATLPGRKYVAPSGRVVDIWGVERLHQALQQYPEHSHASSRLAWDCEHGCLVMFPNTAVRVAQADVPLIDPVPGVTW